MSKKVQEVYGRGPSVDGAPSFRGGPYGFGAENQLAGNLNKATQKIKDQEQDEHNKNVEDLAWRNTKKYKNNHAMQTQDGIHQTEHEEDVALNSKIDPVAERIEPDFFAPSVHLPGNLRDNATERPEVYVPQEDPRETDDYMIDDLVDELTEAILQELGFGAGSGGANFVYNWPSGLPAVHPREHEGEIGHMGMPAPNNGTPIGMGAVLFPKEFVPQDAPQQSKQTDADLDGISDTIDKNEKSELEQELSEQEIDELTENVYNKILEKLKCQKTT